MIYLTFYHGRNVFGANGQFVTWIKNNFDAKFDGFEYGHYLPTISITLQDFEKAKHLIPTKDLIRIEGKFDIFTQLVYGVRNFRNELHHEN